MFRPKIFRLSFLVAMKLNNVWLNLLLVEKQVVGNDAKVIESFEIGTGAKTFYYLKK